jgi:metal-responsive CopG/Arc/MetJ family transcriptional regulator
VSVKTTISLPEELFERLEQEVRDSGTTRSRLVAQAIEGRLRRQEDLRVQEQLNAVYGADPTQEDRELNQFLQRAARTALAE